jgi:protein-disulfide isomerase
MTRLTLVALFLLSAFACKGAAPGPKADSATAAAASSAPDPRVAAADAARIKGSDSAPVWVVMISDFQCPYCRQWHEETSPALIREFVETGRARLAYINYPLSQHQHALPMAEAAMCAGVQGKFWEMHDAIFDTQVKWTALANAAAVIDSLGRSTGLDAAAFAQCQADDVMLPMIEADVARASQSGARSTPTFLVGDRVLVGASSIGELRAAIDSATK